MAKVSNSVKDAIKQSFGITEGNVEITNAVSTVFQYPPNKGTGKQSAAFGCVQFTFDVLDKEFNSKGEDPVKVELGWGDLEKFHPGQADSASDDDPTDLGDELEVIGNCIYSDGSRLGTNTSWIRFTDSMEKQGFKPEVLGNGFLPDLIGTKGHLFTQTLEKWSGYKGEKDPTQLIFDKIVAFPYDKKGKGAVKAPAGKPAPTAAKAPTNVAAKPAPAAAETGNASEDMAKEILSTLKAANGGKEMDLKSLKSKATAHMMRNKVPVPQHKGVCAHLADADFLTTAAEELEFGFDADESKLLFPED